MLTATREIEVFAGNTVIVPPSLEILEGKDEPIGPGKSGFRILNKEGDQRVQWFRNSLKSINEARTLFNDLVAKGMVPYRVGQNGMAHANVMKVFDPAAEEVIFMDHKALVGG